MPEAPDIPTAWQWLLEDRPGTRRGHPLVVAAAHDEPRLRALYPWSSHGTLKFLRAAPTFDDSFPDDLPFVVCCTPPYQVYTSRYATLLGKVATPAEAVALVVAHLPDDLASSDD